MKTIHIKIQNNLEEDIKKYVEILDSSESSEILLEDYGGMILRNFEKGLDSNAIKTFVINDKKYQLCSS